MPAPAHVSSIEALETFRSRLVVYLSKARPALEEAQAECAQTRAWLEVDRRQHWDSELRRRQRRLDEARQELFSARLSALHGPASALQMEVHRAERAVREAEGRAACVRRWSREFSNHADPLVKQLEQLQHFLAADLEVAVAELGQAVTALQSYAAVVARPATSPPKPEEPA